MEVAKKKKSVSGSTDPKKSRKKKTGDAGTAVPDPSKPPAEERDEEPLNWDEIPGLEAAGEPDPVEVERAANRVLDNVLRRFGWARNERGGIEHVGDDDDRPLKKAS